MLFLNEVYELENNNKSPSGLYVYHHKSIIKSLPQAPPPSGTVAAQAWAPSQTAHLISRTLLKRLTQGYWSNYVQVGTVVLVRRGEWRPQLASVLHAGDTSLI